MTDEALVGFYDLYQISSTRETKRTKEHVGIFPHHPNTIMNWVRSGEFPRPVKGMGGRNMWLKTDIHRYIQDIAARKEAP